jgi:dTDP-4-dehydrorhamnose 3,5-epimerase
MKFNSTTLRDVWLIELEPAVDSRGLFARTFCVEEFVAHGLETGYAQHSISFSTRKGTLRGLHYQREPHSEVKLVRCVRGAIWDAIIDIRPDSPTYRCWQDFELSSANRYQLYIPKGFEPYSPQLAHGIRYNDPIFAISWPLPITEISSKDLGWPDFANAYKRRF